MEENGFFKYPLAHKDSDLTSVDVIIIEFNKTKQNYI